MATITQQLTQLQNDLDTLKNAMLDAGQEVSETDTFTTILPKANPLIIKGGTGGGDAEAKPKDINFYDYDGTRVYSYTLEEFENINELPQVPDHSAEGLVSQGWNWELSEIKAEGKETDVGALYITNDGSTKLYINVDRETTIRVSFAQTVANGVIVDFGDGSPTETSSVVNTTASITSYSQSTFANFAHTYQKGEYVITLTPIDNCIIRVVGDSTQEGTIFNANTTLSTSQTAVIKTMLRKIHIGRNVILHNRALAGYYKLEYLTISKDTKIYKDLTGASPTYVFNGTMVKAFIFPKSCFGYDQLPQYGIGGDYNLKALSLPNGVTVENSNFFNYFPNTNMETMTFPNSMTVLLTKGGPGHLKKITLPRNLTSAPTFASSQFLEEIVAICNVTAFSGSSFNNNRILKKVTVDGNVKDLGKLSFSSCPLLEEVYLGDSIEQIANGAFQSDYALKKILLPANLYYINNAAFQFSRLQVYDFRKVKQVVGLANADAMGMDTNCVIIVPDNLYDEWITKSDWTSFVSKIVKASEYPEWQY